MKSYQTRMIEAQATVITEITNDLIVEFSSTLNSHGFTEIGREYDQDKEIVLVYFWDPGRKDMVRVLCSCNDDSFCAEYRLPGKLSMAETIESSSLKRFHKALSEFLEAVGWTCEVCKGQGTRWATDEEYQAESESAICPHCNGRGKTRKGESGPGVL